MLTFRMTTLYWFANMSVYITPNTVIPHMKEDHCWPKSDLNQTMAWYGRKTRFETKLCPSWWSQIICVHFSQDKFWRWYVHRFTNYTQLYHGLEAILHYGQVDVDSSLQNRTFERKIGPFSDQFAPKSPIADQSPRKSDLVGTLAMAAGKHSSGLRVDLADPRANVHWQQTSQHRTNISSYLSNLFCSS